MPNSFAHDKMCTLWEEAAETTSMKMTLSKDLEVYNMSDMSDKDRAASASDNGNDSGSDREYIPQEYRFETKDGIVSTDADFEDVIDRMIPVNRSRSKRVLAQIDAKGLRDPMRRKKVADGFARDIANVIDVDCYQTMINQATMTQINTGAFSFNDGIDAEVLMLNNGLGAFGRKLFLSNKHYAKVAKELGQASRDILVNDAITRARIPDLATFQTMRSDYLLNLTGNTNAALTINGDQQHTVTTYDAAGFYLDNRFMPLAVTGSTPTTMPVGTKFTIAGVNMLHPETRTDSGMLQTFSVAVTGTGTVTIAPAIVVTGAYRNVTAQAATGAAIVILNKVTSAPSLFYTPESTVIVPGRLPIPNDAGGVRSVEATTEQGLPMRMSYWYDPHKEVFNMKAVVFYDVQVVYPNQLGIILDGQA
jgi:hypothetical protein